MDAEIVALSRIADPAQRAQAFATALARRKGELLPLRSLGGDLSGLDVAQLAAAYDCLLGYRSMERTFRYLHRLEVQRRAYDGLRLCGAYPLRDRRRDVVRVLSASGWSLPSLEGRRHPYALVEPFVSPRLRRGARASLYAQLLARRLGPADLKSADEHALVGQWGVFARCDIAAGTCLGLYGGVILSSADVAAVSDRRYLMRVGSGPQPLHLNGETLLCLANSLFVLDADGDVVGHPDAGYNAELARFPARLAHGYELSVPALFACADIAAGEEVRWNYGLFRKPG